MFEITKQFRFEAAHKLVGHDGKCARLHGHSWVGKIVLRGSSLVGKGPKEGMLADFSQVKEIVNPTVEAFLDHHYLNETLKTDRPTSEFVAWWLFERWKGEFGRADSGLLCLCNLAAVEIMETCTSSATFTTDHRIV